jgi:hypothetical protein
MTPDSSGEYSNEFEKRMDELDEGLLEAFAAGYAKAMEHHDVDRDVDQVRQLKQHDLIRESHFYYWDGRDKPLERWLRNELLGGDSW